VNEFRPIAALGERGNRSDGLTAMEPNAMHAIAGNVTKGATPRVWKP
jgi:hypothetical protein